MNPGLMVSACADVQADVLPGGLLSSKMGRIGAGGSGDEFGPEGEHDSGDWADDAVRFFDAEGLDAEWSAWVPGPDYTAAVREAKRGEAALRRVLATLRNPGSRVRTRSVCTRLAEPVVISYVHPDAWVELERRLRDQAQKADPAG
jgi:hypothetical protein